MAQCSQRHKKKNFARIAPLRDKKISCEPCLKFLKEKKFTLYLKSLKVSRKRSVVNFLIPIGSKLKCISLDTMRSRDIAFLNWLKSETEKLLRSWMHSSGRMITSILI